MRAWRETRAAFVFLTRLPVGGWPYEDHEWKGAPARFPVVGALLGLALAGLHLAVAPLGPWPAAILCVSVGLLLTGAFHEDGLADTADALGGAVHSQERLLEILKDSRVGTFGSVALVASLSMRFALLAQLGGDAPAAFVISESLSRVPPVVQLAFMPYITNPERARSSGIAQAGPGQAAVAVATALLVLVATGLLVDLTPRLGLSLVIVLAVVGAVSGWRYRVRAGGICGDFLGATQQLGVIAVLAVLTVAWTP